MDQNVWFGVGRLVRDPEFVPAGRTGHPHIKLLLAVNRVVPRATGPKADYLPCTYWGEDAPQVLEKLHKGCEVAVAGRIYTDMIQRGGGKREFFWEVRVHSLQVGRRSLKNLAAQQDRTDSQTGAVGRLHKEFGR